ncbi:hypothetical protein [uncultured Zoogloea sp.]|uniref:hypothetical protein n=1 Tax=uncultured Zoogloea sp. TaxID=160237 RepID=UPI0026287CBF|nr:hypothetical protein [uncultured Zoogloea sp.]
MQINDLPESDVERATGIGPTSVIPPKRVAVVFVALLAQWFAISNVDRWFVVMMNAHRIRGESIFLLEPILLQVLVSVSELPALRIVVIGVFQVPPRDELIVGVTHRAALRQYSPH